MRRALSISLILFFGLVPLAATLGASEDAHLPACCRRNGAHHCAESMRMTDAMIDSAPGKAIVTAPPTCPGFPGTAGARTTAPQALTASPVGMPALLAQLHTPQAASAAARLSLIRTRSGRGPPIITLA